MKFLVKTPMNVAFAGVMFSLLALAAAPAYSQGRDIHSFVTCLKSITKSNPTVADAVACVPSNCYATVTLSQESAQPACTLRDGTRLPRVIFSCPETAPNQDLRFRPSFSLCTNAGVINHIELGEDIRKSNGTDDPDLRGFPFVQKMADIDATLGFQTLQEFGTGATAIVDTQVPANSKGCAECHDKLGTLAVGGGNVATLFGPIAPLIAEGTIFTNDPAVLPLGTPAQTPFSNICRGIANSSQLARTPPKKALATALCTALLPKVH